MKYLVCVFFVCFPLIVFPQFTADSLEILLSNKKGVEKVDLLFELAFDNWSSSSDDGLNYAEDALQLAKKIKYTEGIGWALNALGLNYLGKSSYSQSLKYLNESVNVFDELNFNKGLGNSYNILSIVYRKMGDYDKSLECAFKSLGIQEEEGNDREIAFTLNNIGNIYIKLNNYDKALEYLKKSLAKIDKPGNEQNKAGLMNNIAVVYQRLGQLQKALDYYLEILQIRKETDNQPGIATSLNNIGSVKEQLGDLKEALEYFVKALKIKEEIGDKSGSINVINNIGGIYTKLGLFADAEEFLEKGKNLASEINSKELISDNYEHLSDMYTAQKKYEKALHYFRLHSNMKDSIFNEESSLKIAELETSYETEKKEKENVLLLQDNEIQKLEIKNQKSLIRFFIVLSVLIISMGVFIFLLFLNNKKSNQLLRQKNEVIVEQSNKLSGTLDDLNEAINTKNKFFSIIAHDLKNPFNTLLGLSQILSDNYSQYTDEERERFIREIHKSSKHTFNLLDNMLTWANLQQQRIKTNREKFNIKSFVDETISPYLLNADLKGIQISNNIPDNLFVLADRFSINCAIANLVSNAIKFTPANGEVSINATSEKSYVKVTVRDTGVGMEKKVTESLFLIEKAFSTVGTNNENGTGLGLVLCKEFIELNDGKIWVESELGKGSTFSFQLEAV